MAIAIAITVTNIATATITALVFVVFIAVVITTVMIATMFIITIICIVNPWFLTVLPAFGLVYAFCYWLSCSATRDLQRLEAVSRSPIFSQFSACLEGASTIRAFRAEQQFIDTNLASLERNLRAYYLNISSNRWLALRLEFVGTIIVVLASLLAPYA